MDEKSFDIRKYLDDPRLVDILQFKMDSYQDRPNSPGAGKRYLRNPEDSLIEMGLYQPHKLIEEFFLIVSKKSKLSHSLRDCIARYVTQSLIDLHNREHSKSKKDGNTKESGN